MEILGTEVLCVQLVIMIIVREVLSFRLLYKFYRLEVLVV